MTGQGRVETATLAGGCFWCLDGAYRDLRGVIAVESGYAGGQTADPTYEQVCSGTTGHAEVVRITYDPDEVTYRDLLEVFFSIHDPTTLNRQGADVGTQYRSGDLLSRRSAAGESPKRSSPNSSGPRIRGPDRDGDSPLDAYYPGEAYHQDYYRNNPGQGYCQVVVAPKLAKFRAKYASMLKDA